MALKGARKSHKHKKMITSQSIIMMDKTSDEYVGRPSGINISDDFGGVMAPGLKAMASVDNNSLICGCGWRNLWDRDVC